MTSGTDDPFQAEIEAAVGRINREPLGKIINRLIDINERAIVASYRDGMSLRQCEAAHGVDYGACAWVIRRRAPEIMRSDDWRGGRRPQKNDPPTNRRRKKKGTRPSP